MTANELRARFLLYYEGARLANRTFNDREISDFLTKAELEYVQVRVDKLKNRTQRGIGDGLIRSSELAGLVSGVKTYRITDNVFLVGNRNNGALLRPDLDSTLQSTGPLIGDYKSDQYGIFLAIPDEAMYIVAESCDLKKAGNICPNVKVKEITYEYYANGIYDPYANPSYDLVWALDWGSFTTATVASNGTVTPSTKDKSTGVLNATYNMTGLSILDNTTTVNINSSRSRQLILGKGFTIENYRMNYIIKPKGINVNVQVPSEQKHSILPDYTHQDIVDIAVRLAAASITPEQNKYQVNQIESQKDE